MDLEVDEVTQSKGRPTEVIVDLSHIQRNTEFLKSLLGPSQRLMAVVKADGYGHGAVAVAKAALRGGAAWLGVALAEEGVELRDAGVTAPILVLGPSHPSQMLLAVDHHIDLTVFDRQHLIWAAQAARRCQTSARIHLKLDTGMGRVGLLAEQLNQMWLEWLRAPELTWIGVSTHFASSDAEDSEATRTQLQRFLDALEFLRAEGALPPEIHAANSAAIMRYPGTHFTLARAGLALYGLKPYAGAKGLEPALRWISQVAYVKEVPAGFAVGYGATYRTPTPQKLLSVPVGYADGYRRAWSNRSQVLIGGCRYPVVGNISMDQITVATPLSAQVAVGDVVTLLGPDGTDAISAEELAQILESISYEVVTGIGKRVPRRYRPH